MTLRLGGVIFGDVLTEVYGYRRSRRVVWVGFGAVAMASLTFFLCDLAPRLEHQQAFLLILGQRSMVLAAYSLLEVAFEALSTPVTYALVGHLEEAGGVDIHDHDTDFNPFLVRAW